MPNHQHYYSFIISWYNPTSGMQAMFGIFTYKETYSSLKMCKI